MHTTKSSLADDAPQVVTLESWLKEMVDREAVARMPAIPFVSKQASSYDRRKSDPFDAKTWHSNSDRDHFIHTEMHDGRKEWVMMEAEGPGAVVRIWTPLQARRLRLLDDTPFQTSLKHDMEIWHWADTKVDYAVGCFWYARPGAKCNREPQPAEAAMAIHELPSGQRIAGAIECETLPITAKSEGLLTETQESALAVSEWSGEAQILVRGTKVGDFIELQIPATGDQPKDVTLYATKSWDYGILRFSVNGQPAGKDYDAFNKQTIATGPIALGSFKPKDGKFVLRVEVVGANPSSKATHSYFGLDCVVVK